MCWPAQVRDVTSIGLQFGNLGFDSPYGTSFGAATADSSHYGAAAPERQSSAAAEPQQQGTPHASGTPSTAASSALEAFAAAAGAAWARCMHSALHCVGLCCFWEEINI
jgi:hypothetical protein